MLAFALSRTDRGIVDFYESGWNPSPEAAIALAAELVAAVLLVVILVRDASADAVGDASAPQAVERSPWAPAPPAGALPPPPPPGTPPSW
jgi:hypothetical protein